MKTTLLCIPVILLLVSCQEKKVSDAEMQRAFLSPDILCGTVQFTDGCGASTDSLIRFGLALIHHMTYEDAAYTFSNVIEKDPDCFWGYWGKSMTYIHPLWPDVPSEKEMEDGFVLSSRALSLAKSEKEKLYAAIPSAYYSKSDKSKSQRLADMEMAWQQAHTQLPDDVEVELFHGLFRLAITPPTDTTFVVQREVGAMAERMLAKYPDHPAAYHYGIHAYDTPALADKAIALARQYGKIAPEIPHALHMPSHIFTRLGYWDESINWNTRSGIAALQMPYDKAVSPHFFHAQDYKVYAMLQYGEDEAAKKIWDTIQSIKDPIHVNPSAAYALAAIPARLALETHNWEAGKKITLPDTNWFSWKKFPQYESMFYFTQGISAARTGDIAGATAAKEKLNALQQQLGNTPQSQYFARQIESQAMSIDAWQMLAEGKQEQALKTMQAAADIEDGMLKNPVSPGSLLPARELLGDMYFESALYADALAAYEQSLTTNPNRYNTYLGAGLAAEKMNDAVKKKQYFSSILQLKGKTPSLRKSFLYAQKAVQTG